MRYFIIALALVLLPVSAQAGTNGLGTIKAVVTTGAIQQAGLGQQQGGQVPKPPKAKLPNTNAAKVKQLDMQMKALKQKMESISGLPQGQQQRIDQMYDLLIKMMALMNSLTNMIEEDQKAQ